MSAGGRPREAVPNRHIARLQLICVDDTGPKGFKGRRGRATGSNALKCRPKRRSLKDARGYRYTVVFDVKKNSDGK
jgi:hypothetical protein